MRIREIAQARVRYGYRKIRALLNREGWNVGKYLVCRLYKEEGMTLKKMLPRRKRKAIKHREERFQATGPDQAWSIDFVADQLQDGRRFRALTVVDIFTREGVAIEVGPHCSAGTESQGGRNDSTDHDGDECGQPGFSGVAPAQECQF